MHQRNILETVIATAFINHVEAEAFLLVRHCQGAHLCNTETWDCWLAQSYIALPSILILILILILGQEQRQRRQHDCCQAGCT